MENDNKKISISIDELQDKIENLNNTIQKTINSYNQLNLIINNFTDIKLSELDLENLAKELSKQIALIWARKKIM